VATVRRADLRKTSCSVSRHAPDIDPQFQQGEQDIAAIELDHRSRDDIPRLLRGLQYICTEVEVRERVFAILAEMLPERVDGNGAVSADPGMPQWRIPVLGTLWRSPSRFWNVRA
jgi:transposase, IS5 family